MDGSRFIRVTESITIGCMSKEARDLLDTIMEQWETHLAKLKVSNGQDYEPSYYGFAYWLCRWSGLVQPAAQPNIKPTGAPSATPEVKES